METLAPPLPARAALDRARRSRDARFDGRFFVGVTSTGVYCRPVCPAPSPRDRHVRYFPTAAAAGDAGFRPCLRCRPEAAPGTPAWLGTADVNRIEVRGLRIADVRTPFRSSSRPPEPQPSLASPDAPLG